MADKTDIGISIVTPIYNHSQFFDSYLESILPQLRDGDEIILVDDASTDELQEKMESTRHLWEGWLRFNTASEHRGASKCRNAGIQMVKNDWIKFLDADDFLYPDCLDNFREAIRNNENKKLFIGKQVYHGPGIPGKKLKSLMLKHMTYTPHLDRIERRNPFVPSMTVVEKKAVVEVGSFDERIQFEEDWDLWIRLYQKYGIESFLVCDFIADRYNYDPNSKVNHDIRISVDVEGMHVREHFRRKYGINPLMPKRFQEQAAEAGT